MSKKSGCADLCDLEDSAIEYMHDIYETTKNGASNALVWYNEPSPKMAKSAAESFFTIRSGSVEQMSDAEKGHIIDIFTNPALHSAGLDSMPSNHSGDEISGKKRPWGNIGV